MTHVRADELREHGAVQRHAAQRLRPQRRAADRAAAAAAAAAVAAEQVRAQLAEPAAELGPQLAVRHRVDRLRRAAACAQVTFTPTARGTRRGAQRNRTGRCVCVYVCV